MFKQCLKIQSRSFHSSLNARTFYHYKTIISPGQINLTTEKEHLKFQAKSLILLSTPSNLTRLIDEAIRLTSSDPALQLFLVGVDSVSPKSQRNGYAQLWLSEYANIKHNTRLESRDDLNNLPRESDGINPVFARKNWKQIESKLNLSFTLISDSIEKLDLSLKPANTVFSTGELCTMFYVQPLSVDCPESVRTDSGYTLCDLSVELPSITHGNQYTVDDNLEPLLVPGQEELYISSCIENLMKEINGRAASSFLQENEKLMKLGSKDTEVYAVIYNPISKVRQRFKVIAGGGSWGAKANILVVSPGAKLENGMTVEFYMLQPKYLRIENSNIQRLNDNETGILLECCYKEDSFSDANHADVKETSWSGLGIGAEDGIVLNGRNYDSVGEMIFYKN